MPEAEGLIFNFENEDKINTSILETIDYSGHSQEIIYETDEFSAVCPFSGLPDLGKVTIIYRPGKKIIELKSLKYYFVSYRNIGIYQEAATDRIFRDLFHIIKPEHLIVKTEYRIRGGILSKCIMDSSKL